jgi:hypothetical protein
MASVTLDGDKIVVVCKGGRIITNVTVDKSQLGALEGKITDALGYAAGQKPDWAVEIGAIDETTAAKTIRGQLLAVHPKEEKNPVAAAQKKAAATPPTQKEQTPPKTATPQPQARKEITPPLQSQVATGLMNLVNKGDTAICQAAVRLNPSPAFADAIEKSIAKQVPDSVAFLSTYKKTYKGKFNPLNFIDRLRAVRDAVAANDAEKLATLKSGEQGGVKLFPPEFVQNVNLPLINLCRSGWKADVQADTTHKAQQTPAAWQRWGNQAPANKAVVPADTTPHKAQDSLAAWQLWGKKAPETKADSSKSDTLSGAALDSLRKLRMESGTGAQPPQKPAGTVAPAETLSGEALDAYRRKRLETR